MRALFFALLRLYQILSPSLQALSQSLGYPGQCRFPVSCSQFAKQCLRDEPSLLKALTRIVRRLFYCAPWGPWLERLEEKARRV